MFSQFCIGMAGGAAVDIDAFRGTMADLRSLTVAPLPNGKKEGHGQGHNPRPPMTSDLDRRIEIVLDYGRECVKAMIRIRLNWCGAPATPERIGRLLAPACNHARFDRVRGRWNSA